MASRWKLLVVILGAAAVVALFVGVVLLLRRPGTGATPPATATATAVPPTATVPVPAATVTAAPPPATATPMPPATATPASAATLPPATATATVTSTPPPATATATLALPTPTATLTVLPATATATPAPPTATATVLPPTATVTLAPTRAATPITPTANVALTLNNQRITFGHAGGWKLKQETKDRYSVVTLEEPRGALLSLTIYGMDMEPRQLSSSLLDQLKKQFSGLRETPLTGTLAGYAAEGYTLRFTYQNVPMTGTILSCRTSTAALTLYTQAADADLDAVQPAFDVVKNTLVVK